MDRRANMDKGKGRKCSKEDNRDSGEDNSVEENVLPTRQVILVTPSVSTGPFEADRSGGNVTRSEESGLTSNGLPKNDLNLKRFTKKQILDCFFPTQRPHQCPHCSKSFGHKGHLNRHIKVHTGERPFHCQLCTKSFVQSADLRRHIRIHTGERPYQCQFCTKSFVQSGDLQIHIRIHTGARPYQCQLCTKSFRESSSLKKHNRTHTGERPHQCQLCEKSFRQSKSLKRHMKTHNNTTDNE